MLPNEHLHAWLPMYREEFWTTITCVSTNSPDSNVSNRRTKSITEITGKSLFSTNITSSTMLQSTINIIEKQKDNGNLTENSENHITYNNGVIVGGVLGALAIIGVIVLVIILKLRKTKAAAKSIYIEPNERSSGTSHMYTDIQRTNPSNNKTVNRIYENEVLHAGRPSPVGTTATKIENEKERKKPIYDNTAIMTNNITST
ncbi:unnamed protein product [Mytilus edulis]|uniref:Mid2 domain-containing protein n=1 Tax=Mytilus edulis TaxID=6550 RepID=A0A8S3TLX4_MYTED|nr:unnamed protein product [Mytilus edulis]